MHTHTHTHTSQAVNSQVEVTGDDPTAVRDIKQLSYNNTVCMTADYLLSLHRFLNACSLASLMQLGSMEVSRYFCTIKGSYSLNCVHHNVIFLTSFSRPLPVLTANSLATLRSALPKKAVSSLQKVQ